MKQQDAKRQIIKLWSVWEKNKPGLNLLEFYGHLEREHPKLLEFKCTGKKYDKIKEWLAPYADRVDN